jgi:predicted RNA-binding Zn-ribbon protein involved in translation (DUF1610 family)
MENAVRQCPKCGDSMVRGVQVYRLNANYYPFLWVEGEPVKRSLLGIRGTNLDVSGREVSETVSFKCAGCGFLESYAV